MTHITLRALTCILLCSIPVWTHAGMETYTSEEIVHLPWGSSPGAVGLFPGGEEQEPQGPEAIAVDVSGRVYLLDVVNYRIQQYSREGHLLRSIPLQGPGYALCVTDDGTLYVLDPFGSSIAQYDLEGYWLEGYAFELPAERGGDPPVTRIMEGPGGGIWLGTYRDVYPVELAPQHAQVGRLRKGIPGDLAGTCYVIERVTEHRARIVLQDEGGSVHRSLLVDSLDPIASVVFLRTDRVGCTYILLETFRPSRDGTIAIGKGVRKLDPTGEVVAQVELPLGYTYCYGGDVAVGEDGTLYHLWSQPDGVHLIRWHKR